MLEALVFGLPVLLGAVLGAVFARSFWRTYAVLGLGLLIGLGLVLWAYLSSPPDALHATGAEGEQFLGRYWEPEWVFFGVGIGYLLYLVGVGVGAFTRELVGLFGTRDSAGPDRGESPENGGRCYPSCTTFHRLGEMGARRPFLV